MIGRTVGEPPDAHAAADLRLDPTFWRYLAAFAITVSGNWAQNIAVALLAAQISDSALFVGIAVSLRQLPLLVLGSPAGRFADQHSKPRILAGTQLVGAVVTFGLWIMVVADEATAAGLVVLSLIGGLAIDAG